MNTDNNIYRVNEEDLQSYAAGQAVSAIIPGLIIYGIISVFLLGFGFVHMSEGGLGLFQIFGFLSVIFLIIFLIIGLGRQVTAEKQIRNTLFIVNNTQIRSLRDESDKGIAGIVTDELIRARYGVRLENDTTIDWDKVQKIKWKKRGIDIVGPNFDIFSGNGKIFVPKELDGYEAIKELIAQKLNQTKHG